MTTSISSLSAVRVCPERDIECGSNPAAWCSTCPKRGADKATDERALFEEWAGSCNFMKFSDGSYVNSDLNKAWSAWEFRAALAAVPESEAVRQLSKERDMWKANHDAMRDRCSILRQRTDLPVERIPAYEALVAAQNLAGLYAAAPAPVSGMPDLAIREALELIVECFGPCENDYIFSKRHALQKARSALAPPSPQAPDTPVASSLISRSHAAEGQWMGDATLPAAPASSERADIHYWMSRATRAEGALVAAKYDQENPEFNGRLDSWQAVAGKYRRENEELRAALAARKAPTPAAPEGQAGAVVGDLSMLVRRLAHSLSKAAPAHALPAQAVDYLQRKGLQGNPLRDAESDAAPLPRQAAV